MNLNKINENKQFIYLFIVSSKVEQSILFEHCAKRLNSNDDDEEEGAEEKIC